MAPKLAIRPAGRDSGVFRAANHGREDSLARQPVQRAEEKLKRIIEATLFEGGIGPVTARELVEMPEAEWGILRDRITDYRQGRPAGVVCRCVMCGDPVFIRARRKNGVHYPLFSHFQGGGLRFARGTTEQTSTQKELREEQYSGQQESRRRIVCCVNRSTPWRSLTRVRPISSVWSMHIGNHRPKSEHGRFPDVQVVWRDFPECVFEVQLSRTFQTEISALVHALRTRGRGAGMGVVRI